MFVGLIRQNQWFIDRVNLFISFAALARMDNIFGLPLIPYGNPLPYEILRRFNINRFPPIDEYIRNSTSLTCQVLPFVCQLALNPVAFYNPVNDNLPAGEALQSRLPSPSSMMLMEHFAQIHQSGRFQDYDYGPQSNMARYGSETPPEFDLTQITGIPVALFVQSLDNEGDRVDSEWLLQQIDDIVVFNRTYQNYAHFDLYVAENTTDYLVDVVDLLEQFNQG